MSDQPLRATGHCLCGGVRFDVLGPLRAVILCHCSQCRHTHGHFAAYTSASRSHVVFQADSTLRWYESSASARRGFCSKCGASLFWEPTGENRLAIAAGCLDSPTGLSSERHIFVDDAADYYRINDDLPRDGGHPGRA
jgi:hypothetical protein